MEHKYCAEYREITLRPLHERDLDVLRQWRNDKNISKFLRPLPEITEEAQLKWYHDYLQDKSIIFFVIEHLRITTGTIAVYNIRNHEAEIGKIVVGRQDMHGRGIGYNSLLMAMYLGIQCLSIKNFYLEVHENNMPARTIYHKAGFSITGSHNSGREGDELEMMTESKKFERLHPNIKEIRLYEEFPG